MLLKYLDPRFSTTMADINWDKCADISHMNFKSLLIWLSKSFTDNIQWNTHGMLVYNENQFKCKLQLHIYYLARSEKFDLSLQYFANSLSKLWNAFPYLFDELMKIGKIPMNKGYKLRNLKYFPDIRYYLGQSIQEWTKQNF